MASSQPGSSELARLFWLMERSILTQLKAGLHQAFFFLLSHKNTEWDLCGRKLPMLETFPFHWFPITLLYQYFWRGRWPPINKGLPRFVVQERVFEGFRDSVGKLYTCRCGCSWQISGRIVFDPIGVTFAVNFGHPFHFSPTYKVNWRWNSKIKSQWIPNHPVSRVQRCLS